jgi:hypothetical protein
MAVSERSFRRSCLSAVFTAVAGSALLPAQAGAAIFTVAGGGGRGVPREKAIPAAAVQLDKVSSLALTADGGFLMSTGDGLLRVSHGGRLAHVAVKQGPDRSLGFGSEEGLLAVGGGGTLVSDGPQNQVFRVAPDGTLTRFAGLPPMRGDSAVCRAMVGRPPWRVSHIRPDSRWRPTEAS